MIESILFRNFKALRDTKLPLGRFTLIVGPNGSGKSTVLKALEVAGEPGILHFNQVVTASNRTDGAAKVEVKLSFNPSFFKGVVILQWPFNTRGSHAYSPGPDQTIVLSELKKIRIYALDADHIARPVQLTPDIELLRNGGNLVAVLDQLRDKNPERFEALNVALNQWLPEFDRILFDTPGQGMRAFALRTSVGQHRIAANDLSQGTLLALAMLTLAYLPDPPPLVCFEEPDRGIHPRLLRDVQDALYRLSYPESYGEDRDPVQVIATTHSPYFLDLFRDHPEEVVIAEKTEQGTQFVRLSDLPEVDEILRDSHLGEIWYTGILGGVPAHS